MTPLSTFLMRNDTFHREIKVSFSLWTRLSWKKLRIHTQGHSTKPEGTQSAVQGCMSQLLSSTQPCVLSTCVYLELSAWSAYWSARWTRSAVTFWKHHRRGDKSLNALCSYGRFIRIFTTQYYNIICNCRGKCAFSTFIYLASSKSVRKNRVTNGKNHVRCFLCFYCLTCLIPFKQNDFLSQGQHGYNH